MPLDPPDGLPPHITAIWNETATTLTNLGRADTTDPNILTAYAQAVAEHRRASQLINQTDILYDNQGTPTPSPALTIQRQAAQTIARLTRTLGLSRPASPAPGDPAAPLQPAGGKQFPDARWCEDHGRWECTGQRSRGRGQCHGPAVEGTHTCRMHQPNNGRIRHMAAVALRQGAPIGGPRLPPGAVWRDIHPADALLEQVRYWAALCAWLDEQVARLTPGEMVWSTAQVTRSDAGELPGTTSVQRAGPHVWIAWHTKAHAHYAMVSKMAIDAEVDAAALRLQQAQGMQAYRAFQAGLDKLGLDEEQRELARRVMPAVLRDLTAA